MHDPPIEATPRKAFLDELHDAVQQAYDRGHFTAVRELAEERLAELRREFATLTAGHELRRMSNREREELRRDWTPEKALLNDRIAEVDRQIREWDHVAEFSGRYAANEALGWTILPDGTCAKVLDDGKVLSVYGGLSEFEDSDGVTYKLDGPDEQWKRRHQRHASAFGDRVRGERLAKARSRTRPARQQRTRERRPGANRRTASSSTTSSSDPGDPDPGDPPRRRGDLRHIGDVLADNGWICPCDVCTGTVEIASDGGPGMTGLTDTARRYLVEHAIDTLTVAELGVTEHHGRLRYPNGRTIALNGDGPKALQPKGTPLELWWPTGTPEDGATVLVCEGESDALAAVSAIGLSEIQHQGDPHHPLAGITVATIPGTGYPAGRLAEDLRGVGVAILGYDGDQAGRDATARDAVELDKAGIACHDLAIPDGRDVADCLAALDPTAGTSRTASPRSIRRCGCRGSPVGWTTRGRSSRCRLTPTP
jgi:hypothetical protein